MPRVIGKVQGRRLGDAAGHGRTARQRAGRAIFPQGGSTITQQLVRGVFLQHQTSQENSYQLRSPGLLPRALSSVIGARNVNMVLRKREEIRLSLWLEEQMREQFGSKRRAKEEIFARYASFVYMGNGQYGFARAARVLLRPAALDVHRRRCRQGGAAGGHRQVASRLRAHGARHRTHPPPPKPDAGAHGRRALHLGDQMKAARQRPLPSVTRHASQAFQSSAVVEHVLDELTARTPTLASTICCRGAFRCTRRWMPACSAS